MLSKIEVLLVNKATWNQIFIKLSEKDSFFIAGSANGQQI